jgi:hypothetical protein
MGYRESKYQMVDLNNHIDTLDTDHKSTKHSIACCIQEIHFLLTHI